MREVSSRPNFVGLIALSGLFGWAALQTGPFMIAGEIQPLPALLAVVAIIGAFRVVGEAVLGIAEGLEWVSAHSASGKSGTSEWGSYKDIKPELQPRHSGPFWGMSVDKKKPLFVDIASNAFIIGPSGVGKTHTQVVPMIFTILHSKIITDFKPELLMITKRGLEEMGQRVISLNPFGLYTDLVGRSAQLNVMDVNAHNLYTPGALVYVFGDAAELSMQLYPDPVNGVGENKYWNDGTRKTLTIISISESMMRGHDATITDAALLVDDSLGFERRLRSIIGVDFDGKPDPTGPYMFELSDWAQHHGEEELEIFLKAFRAKCRSLLKLMVDSPKTFSSFMEGASQALQPFGFGPLSSAMQRSSFEFDEIKSGGQPLNIFMVGDASRPQLTEKYFGLMQWYTQLRLKRHLNKHVPVYLINDEASNYSIYGLTSLMTWGRGFGIRTIQIFQNFSSYAEKHGKNVVEVLNSESEVKLFLPGQRSTGTIKKIVEILGQQSLMVGSLSVDKNGRGLQENMSESGRPLMTEDEIRRAGHGILIIRQKPPVLQTPVSYSEIKPLRTLADINPHHGKPFLNPVKLKLKLKNKT